MQLGLDIVYATCMVGSVNAVNAIGSRKLSLHCRTDIIKWIRVMLGFYTGYSVLIVNLFF